MSGTDISPWMSGDGMEHWYRDNNRLYMLLASAVAAVGAFANYRNQPSDTVMWSFISVLAVASMMIALLMPDNTGVLSGGIVLPLSFIGQLVGRDSFIPFSSIQRYRHRPDSQIIRIDVFTDEGDEHRVYLGQGSAAKSAAAYMMARIDSASEAGRAQGGKLNAGGSRRKRRR